MKSKSVSALEGDTFVVTDQRGDVDSPPDEAHGLFHGDTRFLSRWILTVDGQKPNSLSVDDVNYFASQFFLVPGTGAVYIDSPISILRQRAVGGGFHEDLKLMNHTAQPRELEIRVETGADFADLFQVKDALSGRKGEFYHRIEPNRLVLGYRRERFVRETWITSSAPAEIDEKGFRFRVQLPGHGEWATSLDVSTAIDGSSPVAKSKPKYKDAHDAPTPNGGVSLKAWMESAPQLRSSWSDLPRTYDRSVTDLAALRFFPGLAPGQALPAAGLPWFMALFGRDSLITSFQALPFLPDLAATTLRVLGARQGVVRDDFRDEEPGRILHEARRGEMTAFEERPHSPYFGTSDATPLFLILLDEYERWTGNKELVQRLESQARAALDWINKYGDRDGDGYVEYERRNPNGLENQCWKDSGDSIRFPDGTRAKPPIATCEIQGYVYDAKRRAARLAREFWNDPELAVRLEAEAAELKRRFNHDYWVPGNEFFALALDRSKRQVDSLASNIGHLLWSGIVDKDKAPAIARHLLSDDLFSGWGVRTMAAREGGYNPIGYHIGTVWPFDNSIIALGLRRYGFRAEAAEVAYTNLEAARYFDYRLPEAFAGYPRAQTDFPVEYPTACSPQAWSAGAPLLFVRAMLGLEPVDERLLVDPAVPKQIEWIELLGIPGRWGRADAFARGLIELPSASRTAKPPAAKAAAAAAAAAASD